MAFGAGSLRPQKKQVKIILIVNRVRAVLERICGMAERVRKNLQLSSKPEPFPATSWPLPQARLTDLPGSTNRRPESPTCDLGGPGSFCSNRRKDSARAGGEPVGFDISRLI